MSRISRSSCGVHISNLSGHFIGIIRLRLLRRLNTGFLLQRAVFLTITAAQIPVDTSKTGLVVSHTEASPSSHSISGVFKSGFVY